MKKNVIEMTDVSFVIKNHSILENVCLNVRKNDIYALIGNNGAGKSTIIKILLGIENDYSGQVLLFGNKNLIVGRSKIGAVFGGVKYPPNKKGIQILKEMCILCGVSAEKELPRVIKLVDAQEYIEKPVGTYSYGMAQRLTIATALIGSPQLLILDEPFNGIDPNGMQSLRILLAKLHKEGFSILLTSHILPELIKIVTRYGVIYNGKVCDEFDSTKLNIFSLSKIVFNVREQAIFAQEMENKFPEYIVLQTGEDYVSLVGKKNEKIYNVSSEFISSKSIEVPTEEEVLLWKMNGKDTMDEQTVIS